MSTKFCLILAVITGCLSSCYKQSIADAMLHPSGGQTTKATMSYEINGTTVNVTGKEVAYPGGNYQTLQCERTTSYGYLFSAVIDNGELVFPFFTDSLKVGNYKYISNYGPFYVTTFEGRPQYVHGPTDNMDFNITSYKNGRISGNFSGQLTPAISQGPIDIVYGTLGSVVIKNGTFNNVPVVY